MARPTKRARSNVPSLKDICLKAVSFVDLEVLQRYEAVPTLVDFTTAAAKSRLRDDAHEWWLKTMADHIALNPPPPSGFPGTVMLIPTLETDTPLDDIVPFCATCHGSVTVVDRHSRKAYWRCHCMCTHCDEPKLRTDRCPHAHWDDVDRGVYTTWDDLCGYDDDVALKKAWIRWARRRWPGDAFDSDDSGSSE